MIDKDKEISRVTYNGEELPISGGGEVDEKDIVFYIRVPNFPAREVHYQGEQLEANRSAYGEIWAASNDMGMRGVACASPDLAIMQFNEGLVDAIGLCNLFCVRYTPYIIPEYNINLSHTLNLQLVLSHGVDLPENASMAELKNACEELGWLATEEEWLAELEYWKNYQFEEQ